MVSVKMRCGTAWVTLSQTGTWPALKAGYTRETWEEWW